MSTAVEFGVIQKLLVTEVTEAGKTLFVQLDTPEAYQVQDLSREIETQVSERNGTPVNLEPGSRCYARASDGVLYRALVINCINTDSATGYFADYGNSEDVQISNIFTPSGNYFDLPTQALCCTIGDFIPNQSKWSDEIFSILLEKLLNQEVYGIFRSRSSNPHPYKAAVLQDKDNYPSYNVTLFQDEAGEVSYSELLVAAGLGQHAICSENVSVGQSAKVFVAFSDSPGRFWLQLSSKSPTLEMITSALANEEITSSLQPMTQEAIFSGVACCAIYAEDGAHYRAQVMEVGRGGKVEVQFVDYGNSATVTTNDLFVLPSNLCSIPAQAIQCCLEGVRPAQKDWTLESCDVFANGTINIELDAQFVDELMPEVFNVVLHNPESASTISELLVSSKCARSSDPTPIFSEPPPTRLTQAPPLLSPPTEFTPLKIEVGNTYDITVPYLESPSVVWGQLILYKPDFTAMTSKMTAQFQNASAIPGLRDPSPGQPCVAQFADDRQWYRCRIEAIDPPSKRARVLFVDFGNTEICKLSELKQLPPELLILPMQGVSFSMHALIPADSGGVWSAKTISSFLKMTSSDVFRCEVVELDADGYPAVRLMDKNGKNVGEHLVQMKLARWKEESRKSQSYQQSRPFRDSSTRGSESRESSTRGSGSRDSSTRGSKPPQRSSHHLTEQQSPFHSKPLSPLRTGTGPPQQPKSPHYSTQTLDVGQTYPMAVIYVESLQDFYVQFSNQAPQLEALMKEIDKHCGSDAARIPDKLSPGTPVLAQFTDDQAWYRAVVTEQPNQGVYVVKFVDYGNKDTLQASSLIEAPPSFLALPAQAIHCSLEGVGAQVSPEAAKTTFNELTLEQEAQGEILSVLEDSSGPIYTVDLTLADGSKPVSALVEGGHISIPRATLSNLSPTSSPTLTEIKTPSFPVLSHIDVCVSYAESPGNFFLQLTENVQHLEELTQGMQEVYSKLSPHEEVMFSLNTGVFCAAKFAEDGVWYRAQITGIGPMAQVWFVDYGNEETVPAAELKTLRAQFAVEECLSIRCTLDGLGSEVTNEAVSKFLEIVASNKKLVAKFLKPFSSYSKPIPIQLFDTSQFGVDQNVAALLGQSHSNVGQSTSQSGSAEVTKAPESSAYVATRSQVTIPPPKPELNQSLNCTVTHVESPSAIICQLATSTPRVEALLEELYTFYAEENAGKPLDSIEIGTICASPFTDGSWYRAKITVVNSDLATVQYIDYGNTAEVHVSELRVLDEIFHSDPQHALKCTLNGIQPIGSQSKWTSECCEKVTTTLLDQECQIIVLGADNDFFNVQLTVSNRDIAQVLLSDGLAEAKEPLDSTAASKERDSLKIPPFSAQTGSEMDVFVTFSESPLDLCCQPTVTDEEFAQLTEDLQHFCQSEVAVAMKPDDVTVGDVVLARYSEDLAWYRARAVSVTGDDPDRRVKVIFIDYGNFEVTSTLREIPGKFCTLPAQAIHCQLLGGEECDLNPESETSFNDLLTSDETGFRLQIVDTGALEDRSVVQLTRLSDGVSILQHGSESGCLLHKNAVPTPEIPMATNVSSKAANLDDTFSDVASDDQGQGHGVISVTSAAFLPIVMRPNTREEGFISHFENPSSFWVQLACNENDLEMLIERLSRVYSDPGHLAILDLPDPKPGQVCCAQFSNDKQWYRGIIDVVDSSGVRVHFVDYGNGDFVSPDRVKVLKQEFLETPVQAAHCSLIGTNPPYGSIWQDSSIAYFSGLVLNNALTIDFINEASSGAWLVRLCCRNEDIAMAMVKEGVAKSSEYPQGEIPAEIKPGENLESTQNLSGQPKNFIPSPDNGTVVIPDMKLNMGDSVEVYISHLTNVPTEFYCQLAANEASIDELMASITDFYTENSPAAALVPGTFCVAQYSANSMWYRAKILKVYDEAEDSEERKTITVHFVDFGNYESVLPSQVLGLNPNLGALAQQAICCSLSDDLSLTLPAENMERFLSLDLNQCYRIKVTSCLSNNRYVVELSDLDGALISERILNAEAASSGYKQLPYAMTSTIDVYVSSIDSPTSFYCQPLELTGDLETMMSLLAKTVLNKSPPLLESAVPGMACLAQFSDDGEWYRAKIERVSENCEEVVVHFVDYGNSETKSLHSLRVCPENLLQDPIQALHCSVFDSNTLVPGASWSEEKIEEFRALLGEESLSLTVTSIDSTRNMCVCQLSANGEPIDFSSLLSNALPPEVGEGAVRTDQSEDTLVTTGNEMASLQEGIQRLCSDQPYTSSASSSSLPATGGTLTTTDDRTSDQCPAEASEDGDVVNGCGLGSNLACSIPAVNISTLALKGSSHSSQENISETESSEEVSDQGGGEGEPLIKAPFTLTLSIPEEFEGSVVYVESPSFLFLQRSDCQAELEKLSAEIEQYCASFAEKQQQEGFQKGDFVLAQYTDEVWYRAKVVDAGGDANVEVFFIDFGNTETVSLDKMVMCPESFLELPCQAIASSLANVPPRDSWPDEYKNLIDKQVSDRTVRVTVVHPASKGMQPTVNIEDLETGTDVARVVLDYLQEECERGNVSNYVIPKEPEEEEEFPNPQEVTLKTDADLADPSHDTNLDCSVLTRRLEIGTSYDVYVASCDSPHSFVVQLASESDSLERMSAALESAYENVDTSPLTLPGPPAVGDLVCAQFSGDSKWYRARVLGLESSKVELLYIDYGNSEECEIADVRALAPSLPSLPPMAIECFLAGVEPPANEGSFTPEASDHFLTATGHGECVCKAEIQFVDSAGHYGVNLFNNEGVNVAQSLFDVHLATPLQDTPTTATSTSLPDDVTHDQSDYAFNQPELPVTEEIPIVTGENENDDKPVSENKENPSDRFATVYPSHTLEPGTRWTAVIISITSLDEFHCQLTDNLEELDSVMADIASRNYKIDDEMLCVAQPLKGLPVCACFTEDETWYRAEITSVSSPERVRVFYVDYGNSEDIDTARIKHLEGEFAILPAAVVRCSLPPLTDHDLDDSRPCEGAWDLAWPESCLAHFHELVGTDSTEVELVIEGREEGERGEGWRVKVVTKEGGEGDGEPGTDLKSNQQNSPDEVETGSPRMVKLDVRAALVSRLQTVQKSVHQLVNKEEMEDNTEVVEMELETGDEMPSDERESILQHSSESRLYPNKPDSQPVDTSSPNSLEPSHRLQPEKPDSQRSSPGLHSDGEGRFNLKDPDASSPSCSLEPSSATDDSNITETSPTGPKHGESDDKFARDLEQAAKMLVQTAITEAVKEDSSEDAGSMVETSRED